MATTVRVSGATWEQLNQRKSPGESFNDIIRGLLKKESTNK